MALMIRKLSKEGKLRKDENKRFTLFYYILSRFYYFYTLNSEHGNNSIDLKFRTFLSSLVSATVSKKMCVIQG